MSIGIGIHVALPDDVDSNPLDVLREALSVTAELFDFAADNQDGTDELSLFHGIKVENPHDHVVSTVSIGTNDPNEVISYLANYDAERYELRVSAAYTLFTFDDTDWSLISDIRPLEIAYNPKTENLRYQSHKGFRREMYGDLVLTFQNVRAFRVDSRLTDLIEDPATRHERKEELRDRLRQFCRSFDAIHNFARQLIRRLDPKHLVVCPNLEIHPFMAYGLYHKRFEDFCADLHKAVSLHERGGLYLTDVDETFPFFVEPRRKSKDYGFLRDKYGNGTNERLASIMDAVVAQLKGTSKKCVPIDEMAEVFSIADMIAVEKIRNSLYVVDQDAPFMYITEAFLELTEHLYQTQISPI